MKLGHPCKLQGHGLIWPRLHCLSSKWPRVNIAQDGLTITQIPLQRVFLFYHFWTNDIWSPTEHAQDCTFHNVMGMFSIWTHISLPSESPITSWLEEKHCWRMSLSILIRHSGKPSFHLLSPLWTYWCCSHWASSFLRLQKLPTFYSRYKINVEEKSLCHILSVCVYTCLCMHDHVWACRSWRPESDAFPYCPHLSFWDKLSHWIWSSQSS